MYFISVYSFLPFSLQRNRTHNRNEKEKKKKKMNERMFHAFVCLVCVNYMAMKIPPDILINFIAVDVDRACEQREERNEDRTSDAGWLCYCCAPFLSLLTMCDCGVSCSFGGGVVVVVVWHIIRPVSMWSRNAESQCHSVLRYANLSLAQSYRSLRQWPF